MNGSMRNTLDSAVGYLLALVAIGFGVVGWVLGMMGGTSSTIWFLSGAILGILAIGVVLDESRVFTETATKRAEVALSWLIMFAALIVGAVGFIIGLMSGPYPMVWLVSSIILALVSVAAMADEGRRLRAGAHGVVDEIAGGLLSLFAICLGVVGFLTGIAGNAHSNTWLLGGVIAALAATAFMFDGERRAAVAASRAAAELREGYQRPSVG